MIEKSSLAENIKVAVRCRPINPTESFRDYSVVTKLDELAGFVSLVRPGEKADDLDKRFTFDYVFDVQGKQLDVYNRVARPIVEQVLQGYNGTIFAYGQTGTGKTYTMEGIPEQPELRGIIPNSFAHIFGSIAKADSNTRFLVRVSYFEIYNEEVRDLLGYNRSKVLDVKERPGVGVFVKDLSSFVVHSPEEMDKLMSIGNKHRAIGATRMNEASSRSHAIYTVTVECCQCLADQNQPTLLRQGKLHLVDLAGSERQTKTGSIGIRLQEANKINLSLSTLGNVISALVDGKSTHIPYRNSKLTRILQDSLGGNSRTVMIANIAPTDYNYEESLSTLRYANRAKNIRNKAVINEDPKDALIRQFQLEIEQLKKQLDETGTIDSQRSLDDSTSQTGKSPRIKRSSKPSTNQQDPVKAKIKAELLASIDADRRQLLEQTDLAVQERDRIKEHLQTKEAELSQLEVTQNNLQSRLDALQSRIIVGGENLLEKAELQQRLLEQSADELTQHKQVEQELRQQLAQKEDERINIEQQYNSLQEEAVGKRDMLRSLGTLYLQTKAELEELRKENCRELDELSSGLRQLEQESALHDLVIDSFIPSQYQQLIEQKFQWNEEVGDWQLEGIAYTGNNMQPNSITDVCKKKKNVVTVKTRRCNRSNTYFSYRNTIANSTDKIGQTATPTRPSNSNRLTRRVTSVKFPKRNLQ